MGGDVVNMTLWVLQVLLAAAFFAHGWLFLSPPPAVAQPMNATLPRWFQLFLGVAEVLAAVGLTLPGLTRIMPWLVVWAAGGVMIVTASATAFHLMRGELIDPMRHARHEADDEDLLDADLEIEQKRG